MNIGTLTTKERELVVEKMRNYPPGISQLSWGTGVMQGFSVPIYELTIEQMLECG